MFKSLGLPRDIAINYPSDHVAWSGPGTIYVTHGILLYGHISGAPVHVVGPGELSLLETFRFEGYSMRTKRQKIVVTPDDIVFAQRIKMKQVVTDLAQKCSRDVCRQVFGTATKVKRIIEKENDLQVLEQYYDKIKAMSP